MKVLITGSSGLIGSEAVEHFDRAGARSRRRGQQHAPCVLRPPAGDTHWNLERLKGVTKRFTHALLDIRDRTAIGETPSNSPL